ncbi:hypothetical protein [Hyalangium rubrum]|uniref:Uncharacterized protein n=1 Tax=Hyalangium rubrum TaxID=3103134 RepID=A0ABU5H533_9BACT|nr:hypothetical protein [Hyalangium sp. s54d21]MDY7228589.1 hypothetical protein [Hyalangium sp. s54d21]
MSRIPGSSFFRPGVQAQSSSKPQTTSQSQAQPTPQQAALPSAGAADVFTSGFSNDRNAALRNFALTGQVQPQQVSVATTEQVDGVGSGVNRPALNGTYGAIRGYLESQIAQGAGAAALMTRGVSIGLEYLHQNHPDMSTREMMDYVMASMGSLLVGPDWSNQLNSIANGNSVSTLMDSLKEMHPDAFLGLSLSSGVGDQDAGGAYQDPDLRAEFQDGTDNQAFHCFFWVLAGYVGQGGTVSTVVSNVGNLKHEMFDAEASGNDWLASHMSMELGATLAAMGGTGDWDVVKKSQAVMSGVLSGSHLVSYAIGDETVDASELSQATSDYTDRRIGELQGNAYYVAVSVLESVRQALGLG